MLLLEGEIEQNEKLCKKKSTTSFVNGRKENLSNMISAITNLFCIAEFKLASPEPLSAFNPSFYFLTSDRENQGGTWRHPRST